MLATGNKIFSPVKVLDSAFDKSQSQSSNLYIQLGQNSFCYSVFDIKKNRFTGLFHHAFESEVGPGSLLNTYEEIFKKEPILNLSFKKIKISWMDDKFTLIPAPLLEENNIESYLCFNQTLTEKQTFHSNPVQVIDARNIFSVPYSVHDWLLRNFKSFKLFHHITPLLNAVLFQTKNELFKKMFIHVNPSHFDLVITEGKKLLFCNNFHYHTIEDFAYFILYVCDELELNPEIIPATVFGEIEKSSPAYRLLHKYIKNLTTGSRTESSDYSSEIKELPSHQYYTVFNLSLCE